LLVTPDLFKVPEGVKLTIDTFGWRAGKVSTEPPKGEVFASHVPEGFSKVSNEPEKAASPIESLVGKPAPEFTLTVLDEPGKTGDVRKAALQGKAVLLDFWATWCGPCLMELPEIQKVIEAYAKDKKDVVVVALNQDVDPSDPVEVRKLVE